jgi:hypothetical protein
MEHRINMHPTTPHIEEKRRISAFGFIRPTAL